MNNSNNTWNPQTPYEVLNRLRIFFFALLSGPLLFFAITYLVYKSGNYSPALPDLGKEALLSITLICLGSLVIAHALYYKQKKLFRNDIIPLKERLIMLFKGRVIQYAIMEGGCLLSAIGFFISGLPAMQALYLSMLIVMGLSNPTIFNMMNDLKLSKEEANILRKNQPLDAKEN